MSMNLLAATAGAVGAVNPVVTLTLRVSTGSTTGPDGTQTPTYAAPVAVPGQVQPMQYKDLMQIDGMNLQGTRRKVYLYGVEEGVVRSLEKGGDLLTDPDNRVWLVAMVLEQWGTKWCSVAVTLQNESGS